MLEEAIAFLKKTDDLKAAGIMGVGIYSMSIQVTEDIMKNLDNLVLLDRDSVEYPYRVQSEVDGVTVYTIVNEEELREHFPSLKLRGDKDDH